MNFIDAIKICFTKYADFNGRARPAEQWWFLLFTIFGSLILGYISDTLSLVFSLATFIPYLAVVSRRLHDINMSGWVQLVWNIGSIIGIMCLVFGLASLIFPSSSGPSFAIATFGGLIMLASFGAFIYFMLKNGDVGDNQYGPSPL